MYGCSHLFGGVAGLPFSDLIGKTIPRSHWGRFYALRLFLGNGVMSVVAGLLIWVILADEAGYPFSTNFVILFGCAVALMTAGFLLFGFLRERSGKVSAVRQSVRMIVAEVPRLLKSDENYRRMFITQMLAATSGLALPFYIIVARERFAVDLSTVGIFLMTQTVGVTVSNLVWGWVSSRFGNRSIIQWGPGLPVGHAGVCVVDYVRDGSLARTRVAHNDIDHVYADLLSCRGDGYRELCGIQELSSGYRPRGKATDLYRDHKHDDWDRFAFSCFRWNTGRFDRPRRCFRTYRTCSCRRSLDLQRAWCSQRTHMMER